MDTFGLAIALLTTDDALAQSVMMAARVGGGHAVVEANADALPDVAGQHFPVLIVVDGMTADNWPGAIARCKLRPQTRQIPIHLVSKAANSAETQTGNRNINVDVDMRWERTQFLTALPHIVDQHFHPPTIYPAGWDDELSSLAREGLAEFNRRDYFEQHEYLEEAWMAEERPIRDLYQGILQVGVAFLQIERNNWRGALKMFRRGLPKLRALPPVCQGIALAPFREAAEQIHAEVTALGPERLGEFDQSRFPQIRYT